MRYLDTGSRDPAESLGAWFQGAIEERISHLKIQTGFYVLNGLSPLLGLIEQLKQANLPSKVLIGSNDGCTLKDDVEELAHNPSVARRL